jgi:hypothetical protein
MSEWGALEREQVMRPTPRGRHREKLAEVAYELERKGVRLTCSVYARP